MYLRLLRNRYDDEALAAVLASPFVGVSNDALVLIRRHAGRRPLYSGIERSSPESLFDEDERLIRAFKQRYERLVSASAWVSLERLCELVVGEHDYDLAVLARRDGRRRYANLRKLMRLARTYEEVRGRDLEGFVGFLRDQESLGAAPARGCFRGGGRGCRPAADDPRGEGARVQGRRRRRRRPRPRRPASRRRDPRALRRAVRVQGRPSGLGRQARRVRLRRGARGRPRGRTGRAAAPLLRRDDTGDRPADRARAPSATDATRRSAGCSRSSTARAELAGRAAGLRA